MVKIFELEHGEFEVSNLQSRITEHESFEEYCKSILLKEVVPKDYVIFNKTIYNDREELIFNFVNPRSPEYKFVHYAKVIDKM